MALVKVLVANLFAGANLQKLEVGQVYDVDDSVADKWIASGKAEKSTEKKGEKLVFELATPSAPVNADLTGIQRQLGEALEQVKTLTDEAEAKDKAHAESLAAETKRADEAEAALVVVNKKDK
ncbi:hypothetical protein MUA04_04760 [Enterobacteriaceae bacterium H11S18]|uniref:hypothetical protein n=1 Tax=Dryocola clanedunensis TaxID=2925396 RepID=UPI0022EFDEAA|nr:hypothetical protein [Dryocola clanedunensis]MCT4709500.1 hypothetical protein [Dryocola clanedunensis]